MLVYRRAVLNVIDLFVEITFHSAARRRRKRPDVYFPPYVSRSDNRLDRSPVFPDKLLYLDRARSQRTRTQPAILALRSFARCASELSAFRLFHRGCIWSQPCSRSVRSFCSRKRGPA